MKVAAHPANSAALNATAPPVEPERELSTGLNGERVVLPHCLQSLVERRIP